VRPAGQPNSNWSTTGEPIRPINASLPDIHAEIASNPVVADKTRLCIIGLVAVPGWCCHCLISAP
jgi:hypothetical protein